MIKRKADEVAPLLWNAPTLHGPLWAVT